MYKSTFAKLDKNLIKEILSYNYNIWYDCLKDIKYNYNNKETFLIPQNVINVELNFQTKKSLQKMYEENTTEFSEFSELDDFYKTIKLFINESDVEYFIRLSSRSPKDVLGGLRPCSNASDVIKTLVRSNRVSNDLLWYLNYEIETPLYLHLIPWRQCKNEKEFRCFVYKKKLVAVSHYYLLKQFYIQNNYGLVNEIDRVIDAIKNEIVYDDYVIDIEIDEENIHIIEFNPYGKDGTTSASLFNWTKDEKILLNEDPKDICVRFHKNDLLIENFIEKK
jgi:hypothetical protein